MPHGHQDYGAGAPVSTIYPILDIGELAARLGSPVTFDRRGNIIWLDDFESGIGKWYPVLRGTGAAVAMSAAKARNGAFSVKLTSGDDIGDWTEIRHAWYYPVVSKIGFEVSFTVNNNALMISFIHYLFDGGYVHMPGLWYLPSTDKLQYSDDNLAQQDLVTGLDLVGQDVAFHTIKMVIDLATYEYVRVIVDNTEYDMSGIGYYHAADATTPQWYQFAGIMTAVASNQSLYVDDVILTQNEP